MRDKKQTIILNFVLVGLCCYFMQFLNVPNILTVVIGAMLCLTMVIQQRKIRIDVGICLLTLTLASYYVIVNGVRGAFFPILYIPLVIYLLAQYAVNIDKSEQSMVLLIFAFVICIF